MRFILGFNVPVSHLEESGNRTISKQPRIIGIGLGFSKSDFIVFDQPKKEVLKEIEHKIRDAHANKNT